MKARRGNRRGRAIVPVLTVLLLAGRAWAQPYSMDCDQALGSGHATVTSSASLQLTGNFSICGWVNLSLNNAQMGLVIKTQGGAGYFLGLTNTGKLRGITADGSSTEVLGSTTVSTGVWHPVCAVYNGSTYKLYLDSSQDNVGADTDTRNPTAVGNNLRIGAFEDDSLQLRGKITDVNIWARALSGSEVTDFGNCTEPSSTNLAAWWKFSEGSGTSAADSSGNSNTATLQSASTWSSDIPACLAATATPTVTPTSADTATPTPTDTPTSTPTDTPTATPTDTPTDTPTNTPTDTPTPTPTSARATNTPTPTPTSAIPTPTPGEGTNTHVTALELTLFPNAYAPMPLYAQDCLNANYVPNPRNPEQCRCVVWFNRVAGTNYVMFRCPDGVVHTLAAQ